MTPWVCEGCDGAGQLDLESAHRSQCRLCNGLGVREDEAPWSWMRRVDSVGLCPECGTISFCDRCWDVVEGLGFHQHQQEATARAEQGYTKITPTALLGALAQSGVNSDRRVEVANLPVRECSIHIDELDDLVEYLPIDARRERLAVRLVMEHHVPLWKARVHVVGSAGYDAWESLCLIAGYPRHQRKTWDVHAAPKPRIELLTWLAWAWVNNYSTRYPKEKYPELYADLRRRGML